MLAIDRDRDRAVAVSLHAGPFAGARYRDWRKSSNAGVGMTDTIYVLNGPNLNLLGMRGPEIYGSDTLDDIAGTLEDRGRELGLAIDMRQSNHEGHLIDWMHEAQARDAKAILLNSGAYTHTSRCAVRLYPLDPHAGDRSPYLQPARP
ncbi:dehydroquinase class II domain-containing protein [Ditylenchus destructor]|uniref:3-dehydroquinate dehydratase n=1 Tax=Ditylenchus destructor TaxID=166010 RepID=A0AAD4MHV3_9BILA|nr:dehydroquinase class II domain-containing protein [Ditylenchus destructor]